LNSTMPPMKRMVQTSETNKTNLDWQNNQFNFRLDSKTLFFKQTKGVVSEKK